MVNIPKIFSKDQKGSLVNMQLPLLPLRDIVVFPHMIVPLFVGRTKSIDALTYAMNNDKSVFLATQKASQEDDPKEKDINLIGTTSKILQLLRLPDGTVKALVEGKSRGRIVSFLSDDGFYKVEIEPVAEIGVDETESIALCRALVEAFEEYSNLTKNIPKDFEKKLTEIMDPSHMADTVTAHFPFKMEDKQNLLETLSINDRYTFLLQLINTELEIYKTDQRIKSNVKEHMDKTQKNYYLNEQIRAIKKEMGNEDDFGDDLKELENRIKEKKMSEEAEEKSAQEFKKLKMMTPMSAEATVVRNYIDWIISLPWYECSDVNSDIKDAEKILNEDHFGLEKPKERILEYLAVQTLVKKIKGPILCFVGPPGVGKTSLAKSISRATGRNFVRLSLGGVRDEAEIRGHRRTYIGAMPGKIIQSLKKAGVNNPVFCLDEIDKMSMDFRGDPSAALLEVLDPEQNNAFNDHYLDLDYDLSDILFVTTANTLPDIPLPLQDRMEIIRLPGYTEVEKYHIAKDFLLTKQIERNGLEGMDISFSKNSIYTIIRHYTREAGVRNLEREIASICRKVAREVLDDNGKCSFNITASSISKYLGPHQFRHGKAEEKDQIGLVTGLAWTQAGGELLCVETLVLPGKGDVTITGKLGDVMKESAQAAVSYVRSRAENLMLEDDFYKTKDLHIHIPEGAIPKDGPSAGISMCTSIVSAYTRKPVYSNIAMTGEITLRGRILPIGGLKEKILAAHRGRIKKVIVPKDNEKDLKEIPQSVLKEIEIILVEHMDEVLSHSLIINRGEQLFKNNDIPLSIPVENQDINQRAPLI
ncbi:MAG: endopeptidase La [Proteobacteria bacterium]|nr:endopeptidase La [Pseudomonadota bacterium]